MIRDFSELDLLKDNKLLLSKAGMLMLTRSNKYMLPLEYIQNFIKEKSNPYFLTHFLNEEVQIEEGTTIHNILNSFKPWFIYLNEILKKDFQSYLDYYDNNEPVKEEDYEYIKIILSKSISIEESWVIDMDDFEDLIEKDFNEYMKIYRKRRKDKKSDGLFISEECMGLSIEYLKGEKKGYFMPEPTSDVISYKYLPFFLSLHKEISSNAFDDRHERVAEKQDEYEKKSKKIIKSYTVFTLLEIIKCIDSLLYFNHPISQIKQSENAQETLKIIKDMELQAEFHEIPVSPYEQIWIEMEENYKNNFH